MGSWVLNLLGTAYLNSNSILLSIVSWASSALAVGIWITSTWGLKGMKDIAKKHWDKILRFARPLSVGLLFVCFVFAAYSMQTQQASDLTNANKRISDLEFDRTIAEKQLKGDTQLTNSPTAPLLKPWVNGAMVIHKVPNVNYNPSYPSGPELIFDICCPNVPSELLNDDSVIAVNYKFYVMYPMSIDSVQLSINSKHIASPPLFSTQATPEMETWNMLFWLYFKCEGTINPGHYDNATLIVIADNTTYVSNPFSVTIPEANK